MTKHKILLIDDNQDLLSFLARFLRQAGFNVITAPNGAEGLQKTRDQRPDVIVSDVVMPDVAGTELLTKIKEENIPTRFIFMTGARTDLRDTVEFVKLGACEVLHKPFLGSDVLNAVNRALALESALALHVREPAPLIKSLLAQVEGDLQRAKREEARLAALSRRLLWRDVLTRLLYLAVAIGCTVLFFRLGIVAHGLALLVFPIFVFLMLVLPFDRIKTLAANLRKSEGRATFDQ